MSQRPASTARLWAIGTWLALWCVYVGVIVMNIHQLNDHYAGRAGATVHAQWRVVEATEMRHGPDKIVVTGTGGAGRDVRQEFDVAKAAAFVVGAPCAVMWSPDAPDRIFLVDEEQDVTMDGREVGIVVAVLAALAVQLPWAFVFISWWRAARAPARKAHAMMYQVVAGAGSAAAPLVRVSIDGVQFQRVMWEPWLPAAGPLHDVAVTCRRAGPRGRILVDVPGHGRLWPVGRAIPSRRHSLEPGPINQTARWPLLVAPFLVCGLLPAVAWGIPAGVAAGGTIMSLALLSGGAVPWRPPWRRSTPDGR